MNAIPMPRVRPGNPCFSSGPCAKRPGFSLDALSGALLGRNHRSAETKARITEVIERSKACLGMPADWRLGVVPGSDTGAMEIAMWSLLGTRPVDIITFESFGAGWATDILKQLKLADTRVISADYGALPDLGSVDDVIMHQGCRMQQFNHGSTTIRFIGNRAPTTCREHNKHGPHLLSLALYYVMCNPVEQRHSTAHRRLEF